MVRPECVERLERDNYYMYTVYVVIKNNFFIHTQNTIITSLE